MFQDFTVLTTLAKAYAGGKRYGETSFNELLSASMEARPGDHCERCPFADLCRSKPDIGDLGVQI
jgi:hypothetical protein